MVRTLAKAKNVLMKPLKQQKRFPIVWKEKKYELAFNFAKRTAVLLPQSLTLIMI